MNTKINNSQPSYWLSRICGIIIAIFFALFATAEPFKFMQLIPSLFVVFVLIIAWENDLIGFVGFLILGIVATYFFSTYKEILNFLLISLPLFIVSTFYLIGFLDRKNKTTTT
jgi:uncharacterized membrane protein